MENDERKSDLSPLESSIKLLNESLVCAICKDILTTPVLIIPCSHNFCSICIRRYFTIKQECPICGLEASSNSLVPNRLVETLSKHFQNIKSMLESVIKHSQNDLTHNFSIPLVNSMNQQRVDKSLKTKSESSKKASSSPRIDSCSLEVEATPSFSLALSEFSTQSQDLSSENSSGIRKDVPHLKESEDVSNVVHNDSNHSISTTQVFGDSQQSNDEAECPVCGLKVSTSLINSHLDSCLAREEKKNSLRQNTPKRFKRNNPPTAKLAYNLLSLRDLRRKLKEIGLPTNGEKSELKRRHQEFVIKYQAESDKASPRPVSIVIEELKREEAKRKDFETKSKFLGSLSPTKKSDVTDKNQEHLLKHAQHYQHLEKLASRSLPKKRQKLPSHEEEEIGKRKRSNSSENIPDSEPFPSSSYDEIPLANRPISSGEGDSPDLYADESLSDIGSSKLRAAIEADSQADEIKDCLDASLSDTY